MKTSRLLITLINDLNWFMNEKNYNQFNINFGAYGDSFGAFHSNTFFDYFGYNKRYKIIKIKDK